LPLPNTIIPENGSAEFMGRKLSTSIEACHKYLFTEPISSPPLLNKSPSFPLSSINTMPFFFA
jgi:hypothetical protein